jgi:hypothetical protein
MYGEPYAMDSGDELAMLKEEAVAMKNELDAISRRMEQLEKETSE